MVDVALSDVISSDELRSLLEHDSRPVVSIYHPTVRVAVEPEENSLHLKDLLPEALTGLQATGMRSSEARALLDPVRALLADRDFWLHQLEGLAIFRAPELLRFHRLTTTTREVVVVGPEPHIKLLLPTLFPTNRFFVLALSQNHIRLLDCNRHAAHEIDLSVLEFPRSLQQALVYDDLQKAELQHHPSGGSQERRHAFHGHGDSGDEHKDQILRYFDAVDDGLWPLLRAQTAPLILAGVEYLHPIYREVTRYRHVAERGIFGNPDRMRNDELHRSALTIVEADVRASLDQLRDRFETAAAKGLASSDLGEVVRSAHEGRVDTVITRGDVERWGVFSPASGTIERRESPGPDTVDLLDAACRTTLTKGGHAYVLDAEEVPAGDVAAIFRY